jgi:ATP-dependent RNA helicase DeaD
VIHHQLPDQIEYYTHRSGRTARAGKKGVSIVLIESKERRRLEKIEEELGLTFTQL